MANSTSFAFYDEVLKKFLYGTDEIQLNLIDDKIIRPDGLKPESVVVDKLDYMLGPGRFALPSMFEVVQAFFNVSGNDLDAAGGRTFSLSELQAQLGLSANSHQLSFNQAYFDDGADDYAYRVFFWSSSAFEISEGVRFVVNADGTRSIEGLIINPLGGGSGTDNFDWQGGPFARDLNPIVRPLIDPFAIGGDGTAAMDRTVAIELNGTLPERTYTHTNFDWDVHNGPLTVGGNNPSLGTFGDDLDKAAAILRLGIAGVPFVRDLYNRGVIKYDQDGYDILYGTNHDDVINYHDDWPHRVIKPGFSRWRAAILGGNGNDEITGSIGDDRLDGGSGNDTLDGGFGNDLIISELGDGDDILDGSWDTDTVVYKYATGDSLIRLTPISGFAQGAGALASGDFDLVITGARDANGRNTTETEVGEGVVEVNDMTFGNDTLTSIEKAAVESGSGADTLVLARNGEGVNDDGIAYIDLGTQASGAFDAIDLREWSKKVLIDLEAEEVSWVDEDAILGFIDDERSITVRKAEAAFGGSGADWLRSRSEVGTKFYLSGGAGDDTLTGLGGNDVLDGGAGNDTIVSLGGVNIIVDHEDRNFIISRGDHDTVLIGGSRSHIELGSKTLVVGADTDETVSRFGIQLHGGVQQWWNESGTAVWSPYNALLSAFPFIGAQAMFSAAAMAADTPYMKFAKYRVDAESGDLLIDLGWGLGGTARITDYELDMATGMGTAGLTVFRQGRVKQGSNSGIKASNGVEQYVNLALYAGWGRGLEGFDPLVLDLDGNGYDLISREYSQVYFEFDSDGFAENAGWIGGNDAFLVRDLNGNGQIDNITEMFGNRTTSGFAALAILDSNGDGVFSIADADFSSVRLWKDANSNGVTDAGELISLAHAGIASISLTATTLSDTDVRGNVVVREASFTRTDGTAGKVGDIALDVSDTDTRWTGTQTPSQTAAALPQIAGIGELVNLRLAMTNDATLLSMVNSFVANNSATVTQLRGEIADILYRWAGVDNIAATAIGSGGFDARKLAFLEKFVAIQLMPRDENGAILTSNLAEVEALWNNQFNQMAFKLIAQGPLSAKFAGLTYYESHDLLRAANADTIATVLAGFLDDMPASAAAATDYWADWGPLLGAFAGTVMRTSGIEVGRDYFFAELVKAADSRTLALDIETLAGGLAIDGLKIGSVSALTRTANDSGTLTYFSEIGSQQFVGGAGQDAYVFGHAIGNAVINDDEARVSGDRIRFAFLSPDDVTMAHDGNDLLITVTGTGETVRVLGQFAPVTTLGADYLLSSNKGVEEIQFANGMIYEVSDIAIAVGKGSADNDTLIGTMHSDVLQGLAGNDLLMGGDDGDIYVVNGGEGQDIIRDVQTTPRLRAADMLIFGENVSPGDIQFVREGAEYDDLRIKIGTGGDSVIIEGQFGYSVLGYTGPLALNSRIEGFSFRHYGAAWSSKEIETLLIERATTAGDDVVRGFGNYDHFQISAGNDLLIGMDGGDVYEFGVGAGNDTIDEQSRFIDVTVDLGGLANSAENDIVRFKVLTLADVSFRRVSATPDLTITITATGETLTVKDQFDGFQTGYFAAQWLHRIERFEFADGVVLNWQQVAAITTTGGDGDDQLWGDLYSDRMIGGKGNDTLSGGGKGDEYVFNIGDGQDVIYDNNSFILGDGILNVDDSPDYVTLGEGIAEEMIALSRSGNDLTLHIGASGDSITLKNQNSLLNTGVFGVWGPSRIEEIRFVDGTVWTWEGLNARWIANNTTSGNDIVVGFALADTFEASEGNDILSGGDSGDIYRFGLGSGQDIIRESVDNVMYGDDDSVEFTDGLAPEDIQLARVGNNLVISLSDGSRLTIEGQFAFTAWHTWQDIELFKFSNGVTWTAAEVRMQFLTSTPGDDIITGFDNADVIDGGTGNDVLRGGNGSDVYHFDSGYGHDVIEESVTNANLGDADRVIFGPGLVPEDLTIARNGDDLVFTVISTGETLTIKSQFAFSNWLAWQDVERFEFADGTIWTDHDVAVRLTGGTPGDDTILGTFRSDTLDGGAGNDILIGGDGADIYIFGRGYGQEEIRESLSNANLAEDDELRFGADITVEDLTFTRDDHDLVISIIGTSDTVRLTDQWRVTNIYRWHDVERFTFADGSFLTNGDIQSRVLAGTNGDDHIVGFVTADRLNGGPGNDILEGLDGADTYVFGYGSGHDEIRETVDNANFSDDDSIEFGPGIAWEDLTFSRSGNDLTIQLPGGQDTLFIGGQLGTFSSTTGYTWRDVESFKFEDGTLKTKEDLRLAILAAASTDDDDIIDDFYTNDTLVGGRGNDTLRGGRGSDTFVHNVGDGHDIVSDYFEYYGTIGDRILFGAGITPDDVSVGVSPSNPADMLLSVFGGQSSVTLKNQVGASHEWEIDSVEFADGTSWSALELSRRFVEDMGTPGDDVINGTGNADTLDGRSGNDVVSGGGGNDELLGGADDDVLNGGAGHDRLTGGLGNDLLRGEAGNDIYVYTPGDGDDIIDDLSGQNVVLLGAGIAPDNIYFSTSVSSSNDIVIRFAGHSGSIALKNQFAASSANGVQRLSFADGTVWDQAKIRAEYLTRQGTTGDDYLGGDDTVNILNGGAGNDNIRALAGDDQLTGGVGNDRLEGGAGNDSYHYAINDGNDVIADGGNDTADKLVFGAGISAADVLIDPDQNNGANFIIGFLGRSESIVVEKQLTGNHGIERIEFADGSFWDATEIANQFALGVARAGNETINGTSGADMLNGFGGNDILYGNAGNDILIGGTGNDYLRGDTGNDTYVFNLGDGQDTIYENESQFTVGGTETLRFGLGIALEDLILSKTTADWNDLRIAISGTTDSILIDNQDVSYQERYFNRIENFVFQVQGPDGSVTETTVGWQAMEALRIVQNQTSGNDVIIGSTAADTIDGSAGNDTLYGWSGNDILAGGEGNDTLDGGAGIDTALFSGLRINYSLVTSGGMLSVSDNAPAVDGDDGTDSLKAVEKLKFSDGEEVGITSPIILDLDGGGVSTLSASISNARYDMDGDGFADDTSWVGSGEGILFLDRDGNGTLSNAGELSFVGDVEGAASDLVGLRAFDSNGDSMLSSADDRFADFRIWRDGNGNGVVGEGEILSLSGAGVQSLGLAGTAVNTSVALGDVVTINTGSFTRTDGTSAMFIDAALTYFAGSAKTSGYAQRPTPSMFRRWFGGLDRDGLAAVGPHGFHMDRRYIDDPIAHWPKLDDKSWWSGPSALPIHALDDRRVAEPASTSQLDRQLAIMVQEMSVFGVRSTGESVQLWQRENVRPIDFFA
ncbi:calcium-binding protein [Sphingopyxis sp. MWB1]|uniref:calcium-binding protein n=1 Tax=Sphingopyxis sp. MWB1 TaxID=1537715 RepID=UPI00051A4537|nr:calcium-binding protein [Sphingopyxis sp. MWB1]